MNKIVKGTLATPLSFEPVTFAPVKFKTGKVNLAGTAIKSGPNATKITGKKREEPSVIVKGRPAIDGVPRNWSTCPLVGQLASLEQDGLGTFFLPKSLKIDINTGEFQGILLDEFMLGNNDGSLYGKTG